MTETEIAEWYRQSARRWRRLALAGWIAAAIMGGMSLLGCASPAQPKLLTALEPDCRCDLNRDGHIGAGDLIVIRAPQNWGKSCPAVAPTPEPIPQPAPAPDSSATYVRSGEPLPAIVGTVLFERGGVWTLDSALTVIEGAALGSFGDGNAPAPRFVVTHAGAGLIVREHATVDGIHLVGPGASSDESGITIPITTSQNGQTIRDCEIDGFRVGVGWSDWMLNTYDDITLERVYVHDCAVNGMFIGGKRLQLLDCRVEQNGSHALRIWQMIDSRIVGGSYAQRNGKGMALKLHGPSATRGREFTHDVLISGVVFSSQGDWTITIGPQNTTEDERLSRITMENCSVRDAGTVGQVGLYVSAQDSVVRHCTFDVPHGIGAMVWLRGIEPAPTGCILEGNVATSGMLYGRLWTGTVTR